MNLLALPWLEAFAAPGAGVLLGGFVQGAFNYVTRLNAGDAISSIAFLAAGAPGTMAFNAGFTFSQFLTAGPQFLGVKFDTDRYGWVRVNMSGQPLNSFTIVDYAYAGKREPITAGQMPVPEPGALGLLALGATGLSSWRRRRQPAA